MKTIANETEAEVEETDFKPLTAQEAEEWRRRNPRVSVWRVVAGQVAVGVLVSLLFWLVSGQARIGWSAAYGALVVVVPSMLFVRGLSRQRDVVNAGSAMLGFFGWEIAKIALSIALLAAAPKLVADLSWLVLVVSMTITMKTYWIALWARSGVQKTV